ncbi:MAG: hypothetical protein JW950_02535 [Deltaproteobacteria bacterium]|nr:hypothetical protein [Deltaproteobacteria bacterium]
MIRNLESVRRITNRALAGLCTVVRIGKFDHISAPAATDGKDIRINRIFPNSDRLSLKERCAVWKGLNYHMLGHILFTENTSKLRGNEKVAFALLEDARIEWLMSRVFPGTRKYFVNNIVKMRLDAPIILWGRRHLLPIRIKKPDLPQRALEIIDAFIASRALAERESLAAEFASLIRFSPVSRRLAGDIENLGMIRFDGGQVDALLEGKIKDAIETLQQRAAEGSLEKAVEGDGRSEASESSGVYDDLDQAMEADELRRDMEDAVTPPLEGRNFSKYGAGEIMEYKIKPDPLLVRQLYRIFEQARVSTGSWYEKRLLAGRVDAREVMRHHWNGSPRIFKKFQEDQLDETRLAVALVLDKSGSMATTDPEEITKKAGSALAWAAAKAGFEVMVLAFDGHCHVVKAPWERGFRDYKFGGGTNPLRALLRAEGFLRESSQAPLLIMITDGEFDQSAHEKLNEMAGKLDSVYVIALGGRPDRWDKTGIKPRHIRSVHGVARAIGEIVEEEERKKVRALGRIW